MCSKLLPRHITHTHKLTLTPHPIHLPNNRPPNQPLRRLIRRRRLPLDPHDRPHGRGHRLPIPPKQNDRRSPVPRNVSPTRVDDMGQINLGQIALHQLLTKFPLHKRIGRDLPRKPTLAGQLEQPLEKRHGQGILPIADLPIPQPIRLIQRLVLHRDIRRIRHHRVIPAVSQNPAKIVDVLDLIVMLHFDPAIQTHLIKTAVPQRIPAGQINTEIRRILQPPNPAFPQRRQQQPEPRNRHRERIDIHPVDAVQSPLHQHPRVHRRFSVRPSPINPLKPSQQKMPRPTGRIDHPKPRRGDLHTGPGRDRRRIQPELIQRRRQGPVQNERLHEIRRLQQRIFLPGRLGQILVQIPQKPRIPRPVREIMDQRPGCRVDPLEKRQQPPGRIPAQPPRENMNSIVLPEHIAARRQRREPREHIQQILPIRLRGMGPEIQLMLIPGPLQPFPRSRNPRRVHQPVVLQKPREHAG